LRTVRNASFEDAAAIAELMRVRRVAYEAYQPTFWREAPDSVEKHIPYLQAQLARPDVIALVAERENRTLAGALVATLVPAPPVYAPGGPTCYIDDYWVEDPREWDTTGKQLLSQAMQLAKEQFGAAQAVVVCAQRDHPKRAWLETASYTVASEWWTRPL
jgi:hypothetical protein